MADLLLELFSEEIPARMQARAAADLKKLVTDGLVEAGLTYGGAASFATPRRLCLTIEGLLAQSPDVREERKGPRVGVPEKALQGFLRGVGLTVDQLEIRDDKKGQTYFAVIEKPGRPAGDIITEIIPKVIRNFPWPKSMRWGEGSLRWVRPLHSILCVLSADDGAEVVDFDIDGIEAANLTAGHRFHAPEWFSVNNFDQYRAELKKAYVMLDAQERADHIWEDAKNMAFAQGLEVVEDAGLLAEVAGLVEWPVVLMGDIADDFMELPTEVLQTSMREHQKFFSVRNPKSGRIEKFITVANRETADHGATILAGNQKVLFARLSDAKFFWENDLRVPLADMGAKLENVTFHNKLGTQAERVARIAALAREIADDVDANADMAEDAAKVAKADLMSEMVYEFPELQGVMGKYYAQKAGMDDAIAAACADHYSPLGPSDMVPSEPVTVAVALADKIDTLTGFWAIDEKPTGSKDPFALRRAALGVIQLVLENGVHLFIEEALRLRIQKHIISSILFSDDGKRPVETGEDIRKAKDLLSFFHDRLKVYLRDKGISHDIIDACLAMPNNDDFTLLVNRAEALQAFIKTDDGTNLLQGFKRANNILTQAEAKDRVEYSYGADVKYAETDVEKALFAALATADKAIAPAIKSEDFATAMAAMAGLRAPIDGFFEAVKINADSDIVRRNRLNLLGQIRKTMAQVADFTRIEG
ncbi:MAG: glycine--tRNA ligase subunit beta [Amylibacter sp.]|nr:glycine--tRNA ligase subunit beta [Amylibacter sp.]